MNAFYIKLLQHHKVPSNFDIHVQGGEIAHSRKNSHTRHCIQKTFSWKGEPSQSCSNRWSHHVKKVWIKTENRKPQYYVFFLFSEKSTIYEPNLLKGGACISCVKVLISDSSRRIHTRKAIGVVALPKEKNWNHERFTDGSIIQISMNLTNLKRFKRSPNRSRDNYKRIWTTV